jgi:hypothetical protein
MSDNEQPIKKKKVSENNPTQVDSMTPAPEKLRRGRRNDTEKNKAGLQKKLTVHKAATKKALLIALEKSLGIVTTACRAVGVDRATHYNYLATDPEYKKAYDALADVALDFAESSLHHQISKGKEASTIFYLKTKGKKRGYIERVENEHLIRTPYDLTKLTEEELLLFSSLQAKMEIK